MQVTSKRFYWLKLKKTFFHQKEIKLLRRIAGGDTYTVIYLKIMLLSIENEGTIFFDNVTETFEEELALELDESVENVQITLNFLKAKGLLELKDTDEFFLNEVPSMIGKEVDSAERVRRHRKKKQEVKALQSNNEELQGNNEVTIGNTEKEKEKEKDKEKDKENTSNQDSITHSFEEVWKLYPKKTAKKDAEAAFKRAIKKGASIETVKKGIESYVQYVGANKEWLTPMDGGRWFKKERWNDEFDTGTKSINKTQNENKYDDPFINERRASNGLSRSNETNHGENEDDLPF